MLKLLIIILLGLSTLISCSKNGTITYHFTGLTLQHLNNAGAEPIPALADSVPLSCYGLRLNLYTVDSSGYIGDIYEDEVYNTNPITYLKISSNSQFDNIPAGGSLNERFVYYKGVYGLYDTLYIDKGFNPTNYYHGYSEGNYAPDYADLLLMKPPPFSGSHIFTVQITLKDGTTYTDTASLIKLY